MAEPDPATYVNSSSWTRWWHHAQRSWTRLGFAHRTARQAAYPDVKSGPLSGADCPSNGALARAGPAQQHRLIDIGDNLRARIDEAGREAWLGEIDGLQLSLADNPAEHASSIEVEPHGYVSVRWLGLHLGQRDWRLDS